MRSRAFVVVLVLLAVPVLAGCTDKEKPPTTTPPAADGANRAPVASLKTTPETGGADTEFTFDASASTDPDGDTLSYAWTIGTAKKTGQKVVQKFGFTDATVPVTLVVTDARGLSATATKQLKLGTGKNTPPVAAITASSLWVKPATPVTFDASGSTDAEGDTLTYAFGYGSVTNAPAIDSGLFAKDKSWSYTFLEEGTYLFHCHPHPTMKHTVTVSSAAPASTSTQVAIKDFKFGPESITVRPNTKIVYTNRDVVEHTVTLEKYEPKLTSIATTGATGTVTFPSDGTYSLVVAVSDGKGTSTTAQATVLVDSNRPDDTYVNSWGGTVNSTGLGLPAGDTAGRHAFKLGYPAKGDLTLTWTPPPAASTLTLTLQKSDGGTDSFDVTGAESPLVLTVDIPAGTWTAVVSADRAVNLAYTLDAALALTLTPPETGAGDHTDHSGH